MEPTTATPTGATATPDVPTEIVAATTVAAEKGDVSTFLDADRAARTGKPFEKVQRPKAEPAKAGPVVTGKGGEPAKGPSAADRDADARMTARIREAVDTSTADLRRQNQELLDRLNRTPAPGAGTKDDAPAGAASKAEVQRYLAMPDAPKLDDFAGNATEHAAALSVFINDKRHAERVDADRQHATGIERAKQDIERVRTFHGRITAYKETDPEFAAKLTPEVKAIHGFARLQQINAERSARGEATLPASVDHAIGEEIYDCDAPAQVAVFLSQHPEELATLRACTTPQQLTRAFTRLETKVTGSTGAAAPAAASTLDKSPTPAELRARAEAVVDRSVSHAPPPAPSLGKAGTGVDPLKKAIDTGDIGAFLELDRQSRAEKRGFGARG
jgi:hypothetical protein